MMICCVDVDYQPDRVTTACVGFDAWGDAVARIELVVRSDGGAAAYQPGAFYERELPYLLAALERMPAVEAVLVDAYVWLGPDHPGLGWHLFDRLRTSFGSAARPGEAGACDRRGGVVVGVAKTRYAGAEAAEVLRGDSARPLYVTAVGMDTAVAAERIRTMHGDHRVPTLIRLADALARGHAR
jgi:deoxyribonuclease V